MYADDTMIYYSHKSLAEIEKCINSDAEKVNKWMKENCLVLNPKRGKTEFVMFASRARNEPVKVTIDGNVINQPNLYEYLGVKLDSHLNMYSQFEQIYKRVSSRIKLLKKVRHQISPMVAETIFKSMILPLIFYCYPIFAGISNTWLRKFESLMQ